MLWNSIYEFFVKYIFGGFLRSNIVDGSGNDYRGIFGYVYSNNSLTFVGTNQVSISVFGYQIFLGNYLSFIATLISIILILVLCCLFVYKIIKLVGGLITR